MRPRACSALVLLAMALGAAGTAHAGGNDLQLGRLARFDDTVASGPCGEKVSCDLDAYRSVMSELAVILAPRWSSPADSLGWSGFQLTTELGVTTLSRTAAYWRVLEQVDDPATATAVDGVMPTLAVFGRKGLWLPLPSIELGAGVVHPLDSRMLALQGYAKLAVHEGFHDWPLPSLAVRTGVSHMTGNPQVDLTVLSLDLLASKRIALGGILTVTPYAGFQRLFVVVRSEVLDATPEVDAFDMAADLGSNFVFPDPSTIVRDRWVTGLKLRGYVLSLTAEYAAALAGTSTDGAIEDASGTQHSVELAIGLDF